MDSEYPGPYAKAIGLSAQAIERSEVSQTDFICNGLVFELKTHLGSTRLLLPILHLLDESFKSTNLQALQIKVNRLLVKKRKLTIKKKVNGYSSLSDFLNSRFDPPAKASWITIPSPPKSVIKAVDVTEFAREEPNIRCDDEVESQETVSNPKSDVTTCVQRDEKTKECNLLAYEIGRRKKTLDKIIKDIESSQINLEQVQKMIGHYSVKNVNKRDETNRKNLNLLRDSQRKVIKQSRTIDDLQKQNSVQLEKIKRLQSVNCKYVNLCDQYKKTEEVLKSTEKKKITAQKSASYYKNSAKKLKEKSPDVSTDLKEKDEIERLQLEVDRLSELLQDKVKTRNKDGSYTDSIRLCVIELTGLEVANEKVSPVISVISKHLFGTEFSKEDLPSSKTVRKIIDEGHYVAKSFIAEKLSETTSWGLNRDGTTRKKKKLLDTSITLASGDVMSLGFTRVARETAVAINDTTKQHITELEQLHSERQGNQESLDQTREDFVRSSLQKLAYSMSDRAANEKKANQLLADWRNDVLEQHEGDNDEVLHFYCMAHVLLGFHTYTVKELKLYEKDIVDQFGPLGRNALKCFEHWRDKGSVAERVCRTVSEVFGPAGDHHGARDLWEAYCAANGVKSLIGNYKDNRFNALFQTAAEILVHRQDFINILESIKSPNLLLKSVLADLKCSSVAVLLQCLGIFYIRLTGPYWNLVAISDVPYLHLHHHVAGIKSLLDRSESNPAEMLINNQHWSQDDPVSLAAIPNRTRMSEAVFTIPEGRREQLLNGLKAVAKGFRETVSKQLVDFLPGGKYCNDPLESDLSRTHFAQTTNLACEHHFGDLDSSQRRRPSASLHHHSSVQLIKRNRTKMMQWLFEMEPDKQKTLLSSARKGGKTLRNLHLKMERQVLSEIHENMKNADNKKRKNGDQDGQPRSRRRLNVETETENSLSEYMQREATLKEKLPDESDIQLNDYVAVAYDDDWYPGIVMKKRDDGHIVVKFMCSTKNSGVFMWPQREDIQTVHPKYVLMRGFIPECESNSGRIWKVIEHTEIELLYVEFTDIHF